MTELDFATRFLTAESDTTGQRSRELVAHALGVTFRDSGELLWVGGYTLGADRREGTSPFGFGDDATVGLAVVIQVAGELTRGASDLLQRDNRYAAAALIRQLVEVEYLAWAFAEEPAEAADWMRSTKADRFDRWLPRHLRRRSDGRFPDADYTDHCERGGHPTPNARSLLPGHESGDAAGRWWFDLASHGVSTWDYALAATRDSKLDLSEQLDEVAARHGLLEAVDQWRESDPLGALVGELASATDRRAR